MMIARVLVLALMPATFLASPTLTNPQDVLDASMDSKVALAKTKVKVMNQLPVDTQVTLLHWRGKDESTKQKLAWDYVGPSKETVPIDVQFETTRKDWDRWQAEIRFRNSDWSVLTPKFSGAVDVEYTNKEYVLLLFGQTITYSGAGDLVRLMASPFCLTDVSYKLISNAQEDAIFSVQGPGFPASAKGINAYFFLYLSNHFDESVSVDVELLSTKSSDFSQKQRFTQKKGERSRTPLPYFYENNSTKDYVDLFGFKVSTDAGRSYTSTLNRCELFSGAFDVTLTETVTVNSTGWSIGYPKVKCDGKWNKRKTAEGEMQCR